MIKRLFLFLLITVSLFVLPVEASNAWTKNQHDIQNTGQSPYVSFSNGSVLWTYSVNIGFDTASLDKNDIIYIPGDEIYALHPNGSLKTTYIVSTFSTTSPVVDNLNNVIYIYTSDKKLYSYSINGTLNWINQYSQTIYKNAIGSDDNTVYMLNNTGVTALNLDGSLKWVYADTHLAYSIAGIAIDSTNNALILTNWTHLISLNITSGASNWGSIINTTMSARGASPAIYNGRIYYMTEYAVLYSFNLDGTENWNYTASPAGGSYSGVSFSPNDNSIYFGTEASTAGGENLWSVYPNGTLKWTANISTPAHYTEIYCNILVDANDVIYLATKDITGQPDYNVFAIYGNNGTIKWQYFDSVNWKIGAFDSTASLSINSTGVLYLLDSNRLIVFNSPLAYNPSGYVNNTLGTMISGARVTLSNSTWSASTTTNLSGYWRINIYANGNYKYTVSKNEYTIQTGTQTFTVGGTNLNFTLSCLGGLSICTPPPYNNNGFNVINFDFQGNGFNLVNFSQIYLTGGLILPDSTTITTANKSIEWVFGKDGTVITAPDNYSIVVPSAGTIKGLTIISDKLTTTTFNVTKASFPSGGAVPTYSDITGGNQVTLTNAGSLSDSTLAGWTKTLAYHNVLFVNVASNDNATSLTFQIEYS